MDYKKLISSLLVLLAVAQFHAVAEPVSVGAAQAMANGFIKSHFKSMPGSLKAPAMSDIVLAYAEPSDKVAQANVYYIFNIKGGGFIIVSGEDHASPVLGYSDKGQIDVTDMPDALKYILGGYKEDIEYLLTHDINAPNSFNQSFKAAVDIVPPMIKTTWGQQEPYYNLCPVLDGNKSKVGCAAICVSQTLYFWQFPTSCNSYPAYYSPNLSSIVPALPATVFDYDKILLSYAEWDFENQSLIQGVYTEEQVQEVAKLCRYCGQALEMDYSPSASSNQIHIIDALKGFGFNPNAKTVYRKNYTDDMWLELLKDELDAGRPIGYSGKDPVREKSHVYIIDGYNSEDYFHMNVGWYGHSNGWYKITAMNFTYLDGTGRHYRDGNAFPQGMEPPLFCTINTEINADDELLLLGGTFCPRAIDVNLSMSYRTLPFMFSLTDARGNQVALSESITLNRLTFENGTDISLALTLPETLPEGTYDLHFNYRIEETAPLTSVATASDHLTVAGKFAKYGGRFDIGDVVMVIDYILCGSPDGIMVDIGDLVYLIDYIFEH